MRHQSIDYDAVDWDEKWDQGLDRDDEDKWFDEEEESTMPDGGEGDVGEGDALGDEVGAGGEVGLNGVESADGALGECCVGLESHQWAALDG